MLTLLTAVLFHAAMPSVQSLCQTGTDLQCTQSLSSGDPVNLLQSKLSVELDSREDNQNHEAALMQKSSQAHSQASRIIFGLMSSPKPKYVAQLQAVEETWAKDLVRRQSILVVGGQGNTSGIRYEEAPMCVDGHTENAGNACKEAFIIAKGHELGADWVVVHGTDVYTFPQRWQNVLDALDASYPQILGLHLCGEGKYCEDHKYGLCGGAGYAVSRGAMESMVGKNSQGYIHECMDAAVTVAGNWSDQSVSCVARRHNVNEVFQHGLYPCRLRPAGQQFGCGTAMFDDERYMQAIHSVNPQALTFHYIFPDDMHKLHQMNHAGEQLRSWHNATHPDVTVDAGLLSYKEVVTSHVNLINKERNKR